MTSTNQKSISGHEGHRERLRKRFLEQPESFTDFELLELLLTFSIPRRDVALLADELIKRFGSIERLLLGMDQEVGQFLGVGESTITLLKAVSAIMAKASKTNQQQHASTVQPQLFEDGNLNLQNHRKPEKALSLKIFIDDEVENSLKFLPLVDRFSDLSEFRQHLISHLPYNSSETRQRRAEYIVSRFFSSGNLNSPFKHYLANFTNHNSLQKVVFYHLLKAEPLASKVAEELIFPSLPIGKIDRMQLVEFLQRTFPDKKEQTLLKSITAIYRTYDRLDVGSIRESQLRFQLHKGDLESFLYILTSEFPQPGIYSYDALFNSPVHRWLLWEKDWIRTQLFNLRDIGVISKIGEIEKLQQFTLDFNQSNALALYFHQMSEKPPALREKGEESAS